MRPLETLLGNFPSGWTVAGEEMAQFYPSFSHKSPEGEERTQIKKIPKDLYDYAKYFKTSKYYTLSSFRQPGWNILEVLFLFKANNAGFFYYY